MPRPCFFFGFAGETKAEATCAENQKSCGRVCVALEDVCYTCGTDCHAYYTGEAENKTLNIIGTGKMDDYHSEVIDHQYHSSDSPWKDDTFKNVVIENGITQIGKWAFGGFGITSAAIPDTVINIGAGAFMNNNLTAIKIPDTVTYIGQSAFHTNQLTSVVLPDSLQSTGDWVFYVNPLSSVTISDAATSVGKRIFGAEGLISNLEIICKGDEQSCAYIKNYMTDYGGYNYADQVYMADNYEECNSTNYYWDGAVCKKEPDVKKRKCCTGCRADNGLCRRVRYTPAEAAKVVGESNTIFLYYK